MICTDYGATIKKNQTYYRLNNGGSTFCNKNCVYSAYKGLYSNEYITKGTQEFTRYK